VVAPSEDLLCILGLLWPADLGVGLRLENESSLLTEVLSHCDSGVLFFESDLDDDEEDISLRLRARPLQLFSGNKGAGM
jgi:hypothetical protein